MHLNAKYKDLKSMQVGLREDFEHELAKHTAAFKVGERLIESLGEVALITDFIFVSKYIFKKGRDEQTGRYINSVDGHRIHIPSSIGDKVISKLLKDFPPTQLYCTQDDPSQFRKDYRIESPYFCTLATNTDKSNLLNVCWRCGDIQLDIDMLLDAVPLGELITRSETKKLLVFEEYINGVLHKEFIDRLEFVGKGLHYNSNYFSSWSPKVSDKVACLLRNLNPTYSERDIIDHLKNSGKTRWNYKSRNL